MSICRWALAKPPADERFLQPPGRIVEVDRLRWVDAGRLHRLLELFGEGRDIPGGALRIGCGRVNIPEALPDAIADVLCTILLRLALVHAPAVVGSGGQPARTLVAVFGRFARQPKGAPGVLDRVP